MPDQAAWELLAKYVAGKTSDAENARLDAWIAEDPERAQLLNDLSELWAMTAPAPTTPDVDALWGRLQGHVRRTQEPRESDRPRRPSARPRPASRPAVRPPGRRQSPQGRPSMAARLAVGAAALAGMAVLALSLLRPTGDISLGEEQALARVFATEQGQRATVRLLDGTRVRLNAASTLTVSPEFGGTARTVRLDGEAFFQVARDTTRPFIVQAGGTTARVLGTSFNVTAYADEPHVRVVVAEGKVAFDAPASSGGRARDADPSTGVVLTADQSGEFTAEGGVVRRDAAVQPDLDWIDGTLTFEDAPFAQVARELTRWYGIEVVVEDATSPSGHLNARFSDDQTLDEVLRIVATAFELRVEQRQGRVHFLTSYVPASSGEVAPGGFASYEPAGAVVTDLQ